MIVTFILKKLGRSIPEKSRARRVEERKESCPEANDVKEDLQESLRFHERLSTTRKSKDELQLQQAEMPPNSRPEQGHRCSECYP